MPGEKRPEEGKGGGEMKFGDALELCRQGKLIRRTGWNGKNQFVFYQEGSKLSFSMLRWSAFMKYISKQESAMSGVEDIPIMGHFDIYTEQKVIQCGWLASQGDMQAEDWEVLE
jgi:hypothetical protein